MEYCRYKYLRKLGQSARQPLMLLFVLVFVFIFNSGSARAVQAYDLSPTLSYDLLQKVDAKLIWFDSKVDGAPSFSGKALQISPCMAATVSHWFNIGQTSEALFDIRYGNGTSSGSAQLIYKDIGASTEFSLFSTPKFAGELPVSRRHLDNAHGYPLEVYLHGYNIDKMEVFGRITIGDHGEWNQPNTHGVIALRTHADPNGSSGTPVTDKLGNIYGLHLGDGKIASFNSLIPSLEFALSFIVSKYIEIGNMNEDSKAMEIREKIEKNYLLWVWAHNQLTSSAPVSCDRLASNLNIMNDFVHRFKGRKYMGKLVQLAMDNI